MVRQTSSGRGEVFRPSLDHFLYLVCAVVGLVLMVVGSGYKTPNVGLLGPAAVPVLVGGLLVLLSLAPIVFELFASSGSGTGSPASEQKDETPLSQFAVLRIMALLAIVVFFAFGFEFLGFPLTASVSIFAAILVLGGKPAMAALLSIVLPALLWMGFVKLLGLTLPIGDLFYTLIYP